MNEEPKELDEQDERDELTQEEWDDEREAVNEMMFPDEDSEEGFNWTQD